MAARFTKATEDAQRYADEHDLERMITQMVNVLVTIKPKEPQAYMCRWLLEHCGDEQRESTGLKITQDLPEKDQGLLNKSREMHDRQQRRSRKLKAQAEAQALAAAKAAAAAKKDLMTAREASPSPASDGSQA
eukprot:TRINITY_DN14184_c0_g1_i1.p1 TRINITY_DN14184_c0_g1~~TRINITY_DN14184_c0_g1_i1.p1  ORF type:complete len:133 (-),score=32.13 TRINITY_DN14184_c0_g1_i1:212-610(-)